MARIKITRSGAGKRLKAALEVNKEGLAFYKKAPRSRLIRKALARGGNNWRAIFLKTRPTSKLWSAPFDYKLKKARKRLFGSNVKPLIGRHKGASKLIRAMYTGRIRASKSAGNFILRINIPFGHPVDPEIQRVMSVVPRHEVEWMIDDIAEGIAKGIEKGKIQEKKRVQKAKDRRNTQARSRHRTKQRALGRTVKSRTRSR